MLIDEAENPAVKGYCSSRLGRLEMIGKSAPPFEGTDLDGKPVNLANFKGNVVLLVFWASWCLPSAAEIDWLDSVYNKYRERGLRIVGVNVDVSPGSGTSLESLMPNIKRFVMDHNIRWPNLVSGTGARDYARLYGVTDIPASVLIGRDGTIIHLDLWRKNLERVIAKAVAP